MNKQQWADMLGKSPATKISDLLEWELFTTTRAIHNMRTKLTDDIEAWESKKDNLQAARNALDGDDRQKVEAELKAHCATHPTDRFDQEVFDIFKAKRDDAKRALAALWSS